MDKHKFSVLSAAQAH